MKKLICSLLIFPLLLSAQVSTKRVSALFLGNSYTYYNNLPLLVYNIALASGDTLIYDSNLIGGYSLANHCSDGMSVSKISAALWDHVILQAQSQEPSFPPAQVTTQTLPFALRLDSLVKANHACSNTVFYETWGRKFGDAGNCASYPPLCTYAGMQNRLKQSYKAFADTCKGIMSPVGEAFRSSIALNPGLDLYVADQSHPSLFGSYLAASVFYEVLFQKSVLSNTYNPGIASGTLTFLQQVAHATVSDSLTLWNLGKNLPWAGFDVTATAGFGFQFQSQAPGLVNTWYFGDGTVGGTANPLHTYAGPGAYTVTHIVSDSCKTDTAASVVTIVGVGLPASSLRPQLLRAYPNPCATVLHLAGAFETGPTLMELSNASGLVLRRSAFSGEVNTAGLPNGLYFIKVWDNSASVCLRFIKNE